MHIHYYSVRCLIAGILFISASCTGTNQEPGVPETCYSYGLQGPNKEFSACRVFSGRLVFPLAKDLTLPKRPFQLLALGFENPDATQPTNNPDGGMPPVESSNEDVGANPDEETSAVIIQHFFYGPPFPIEERGGGERPTVPFYITVPCQLSVNLLLQVLRSSGDKIPGYWVAPMTFAQSETSTALTTLIPRQMPDSCGEKNNHFDLGVVELSLAHRGILSSGSIVLGKGNSKNPLSLLTGMVPENGTEEDTDADGILDQDETFNALADTFIPGASEEEQSPSSTSPTADGIPDLFQ
jgi:hypothetical protein